MCRLSANPWTT